ncbi:MAG: DUF4395 domain-containing protein [Micrococcales bacterium]
MSKQQPQSIDPRGPRFGAAIINVFSIVIFFLATDSETETQAFITLLLVTVLFAIGAILGNSRHPFGWLYRKLVKPRLSAPKELEDPRPPQFAQAVGLFVSLVGVVLYLAQVPYGLAIAAAALFAASTLQAYFAYCLGCQIYLGLKRVGIIRHS